MRAVDTDVLVRLLARDDSGQVAAAEDFVAGGAWVSHVVLAEATWVLVSVYDVDGKRLAAAIDMLLDHRQLAIQDAETVRAALASFRRKPSVGCSDHLILEIARKAGHGPLGTFDEQLSKIDGAQKL